MNVLDEIRQSRKDFKIDRCFDYDTAGRRIIKLSEEVGELSQAYLDYTSKTPHRGKTREDLLEESIDVAIVALDVACVVSLDSEEEINAMIERKLTKWRNKWRAKALS